MKTLPKNLQQKLKQRLEANTFRELSEQKKQVDFSSNDYLGFSKSKHIFEATYQYLIDNNSIENGATGSRLLTGNHKLYDYTETFISSFHNSPAAVIFNSGYNANLGFFSCIPQRNDIILYDELIHASIRDGISLSNAQAYKFKHNSLNDLESLLLRVTPNDKDLNIYVVTESVFSMDGDSPNFTAMLHLSKKHNAKLVVDEAHAIGVHGDYGIGLIANNIEEDVFARIITFGKAIGSHGAAILGSQELKQYLVNFSRPFIYTTALPPHTLASILSAYKELSLGVQIKKLRQNISFFNAELVRLSLQKNFIESYSAIHSCIIPNNETVKDIASQLQNKGYDVKPILAPTVPKGKERLRFCLHAYNSEEEITKVLQLLATFVAV